MSTVKLKGEVANDFFAEMLVESQGAAALDRVFGEMERSVRRVLESRGLIPKDNNHE